MDNIKLRTANHNDLPRLLEFEQGIILAERPYDPTLKEEKISYYDLEKMIDATDANIIVAESNNEVIASGYARIQEGKPYLKHENFGYLGFMYTLPNYRGKGINTKIITTLKEWCNVQNIHEIRLDVYSENEIAIKAYEKAGFKKHLINMRHII